MRLFCFCGGWTVINLFLICAREVRRSRNAALVGKSGIVVQETENTFKVVTRDDKLKGAICGVIIYWSTH